MGSPHVDTKLVAIESETAERRKSVTKENEKSQWDERGRDTPSMHQDTSEDCRTGDSWRFEGGGLHAVLVYLTRSFPIPSQKHGL